MAEYAGVAITASVKNVRRKIARDFDRYILNSLGKSHRTMAVPERSTRQAVGCSALLLSGETGNSVVQATGSCSPVFRRFFRAGRRSERSKRWYHFNEAATFVAYSFALARIAAGSSVSARPSRTMAPPVHHHILHIRPLQRINHLRIDVVERHRVRPVQPHRDQIRALAGFERSDLLLQPQPRARRESSPSQKPVRRGSAVGSPVRHFLQASAARSISSNILKSLLLPAGPSVPKPTLIPETQHSHHRRHAARQFHIARRTMRDAHVARLQIPISASSTQTPCAATVRPLKTPSDVEQSRGRHPARLQSRRHSPAWFPKDESPAARCTCSPARARSSRSHRNWYRWRAARARRQSADRCGNAE